MEIRIFRIITNLYKGSFVVFLFFFENHDKNFAYEPISLFTSYLSYKKAPHNVKYGFNLEKHLKIGSRITKILLLNKIIEKIHTKNTKINKFLYT